MADKKDSMSVNEAGRKGGEATAASHDKEFYQDIGSKGGQASGGNFKNDPERAAQAGRKGGQNSGGNFANDREKASEAGRKAASTAEAATTADVIHPRAGLSSARQHP